MVMTVCTLKTTKTTKQGDCVQIHLQGNSKTSVALEVLTGYSENKQPTLQANSTTLSVTCG